MKCPKMVPPPEPPSGPPTRRASPQHRPRQPTSRLTNPRPAAFHLAAGLTSGFTTSILLQPADLLKTRVQQQHQQRPPSTAAAARPSPLLHALRSIRASPRPLRELWRGTLPSTLRTSLGSALYFSLLNRLRTGLAGVDAFTVASDAAPATPAGVGLPATLPTGPRPRADARAPTHRLTPLANLAAGAFARASVGYITMPMTLLKVRYESSLAPHAPLSASPLLASARAILRREGVRSFWKGSGATALRDAPYAGLYLAGYEGCKGAFASLNPGVAAAGREGSNAAATFASGLVAAAAATALTNPPDAVKTRLQLQPGRYRSTWQTVGCMVREEGARSLFDGLGLRMARKAMSSAIAWTVYEEVVRRGRLVGWVA